MAFAKTRFGKIYYEIEGSGEPLVLVRGLGRWSEHWSGFDKLLTKSFRVIKFDSKGLGRSTSPLMPWFSMRDLASDIALILRTERIPAAHIVGTSLGGMIALEFAAQYPEMTKTVTAINSSVGRSGHRRITWKASKTLLKATKVNKEFYSDLSRVLLATSAPKERIEALTKEWLDIDRKYPLPIAIVTKQLLIALRWRSVSAFASKIRCPVQIILGNDDQFVPRGNSLFLAGRIDGAILKKIDGAGHEIHIDQPEILAQALIEFAQRG